MSDSHNYRQAARRESTGRCYARVIEHFDGECGSIPTRQPRSAVRYSSENAERVLAGILCTPWRHWSDGRRMHPGEHILPPAGAWVESELIPALFSRIVLREGLTSQ